MAFQDRKSHIWWAIFLLFISKIDAICFGNMESNICNRQVKNFSPLRYHFAVRFVTFSFVIAFSSKLFQVIWKANSILLFNKNLKAKRWKATDLQGGSTLPVRQKCTAWICGAGKSGRLAGRGKSRACFSSLHPLACRVAILQDAIKRRGLVSTE